MAATLTTGDVAKLCGVEPPTVRSWVHRGYLKATGRNHRGWPLYDQLDAAKAELATATKAGRI